MNDQSIMKVIAGSHGLFNETCPCLRQKRSQMRCHLITTILVIKILVKDSSQQWKIRLLLSLKKWETRQKIIMMCLERKSWTVPWQLRRTNFRKWKAQVLRIVVKPEIKELNLGSCECCQGDLF